MCNAKKKLKTLVQDAAKLLPEPAETRRKQFKEIVKQIDS